MSPNFTQICLTSPPWLVRTVIEPATIIESLGEAAGQTAMVVRTVNGKNMTTLTGVFEEFGKALEFPDYFGHNSAAFDECMADLSWLAADSYVVVITNAENLLTSEPSELSWLIDSLGRICEEWGQPIADGEAWDRSAKPFHVILHYEPDHHGSLQRVIAAMPTV